MHWTSPHHGVLDCGCQVGVDMRLLSECPAHRRYEPVELTERSRRDMAALAELRKRHDDGSIAFNLPKLLELSEVHIK